MGEKKQIIKHIDANLKNLKPLCFTQMAILYSLLIKELSRKAVIQEFQMNICDALTKFVNGDIKKLIITLPPQHGKTTLSCVLAPIFAITKDPTEKIIIASATEGLARKSISQIKQLLFSDTYKELSDLHFGKKANRANRIEPSYFSGSIAAFGTGSMLTGNPADIGICDDLFRDYEHAASKANRDKVWSWFSSVFRARLNNNSRQLILSTRWNEDDLIGRILESSEAHEWTVINMPALMEGEKNEYDRREIGEALWESFHSKVKLESDRALNPSIFAAVFQQRPAPSEGNLIKREWFGISEQLPQKVINWFIYVDGAYTEDTKNDPTAVLLCCLIGGNIYIKESLSVYIESADFQDWMREYIKKHNIDQRKLVISIEPKASGKTLVQYFKKDVILKNTKEFKFEKSTGLSGSSSKQEKVNAATPFMKGERIKLLSGTWNKAFLDQCAVFPNGKHDDEVDCLVMAAMDLLHKKRVKISY